MNGIVFGAAAMEALSNHDTKGRRAGFLHKFPEALTDTWSVFNFFLVDDRLLKYLSPVAKKYRSLPMKSIAFVNVPNDRLGGSLIAPPGCIYGCRGTICLEMLFDFSWIYSASATLGYAFANRMHSFIHFGLCSIVSTVSLSFCLDFLYTISRPNLVN